MSKIKLTHLYDLPSSQVSNTLYEFLNYLPGPTVVHISGKDNSRCRVIVTLLHANEPSGLKALYELLSSDFIPLVNTKFIIASVVAARTEPVFTHRMLPGQKDLNRCFSSQDRDLQTVLAEAIKEELSTYKPELIIDLHNTSGSGPAFCVSISASEQHLALASHFTHRMIVTDLRLGSLMEQNFNAPVITVEAGGAQDEDAHITALSGIKSVLLAENVFVQKQALEVLSNPRRLELCQHASIAYAHSPLSNIDVTMRQDIEHLNFTTVRENQHLGWVSSTSLTALKLDKEKLSLTEFFQFIPINDNYCELRTKNALTLFMVTTRADIAQSDCLLYFVPVSELTI